MPNTMASTLCYRQVNCLQSSFPKVDNGFLNYVRNENGTRACAKSLLDAMLHACHDGIRLGMDVRPDRILVVPSSIGDQKLCELRR